MTERDANAAKAANPENPLAPLAELAREGSAATRDERGRFITGNIGGGRRRGAKNKLSELLLALVVDDFAEHGARTIATLRQEDPATYLRLVSSLVPRQLIVKREEQADADYADMSYEEIGELIETARRGRIIRKAIEG